MKKIHTHYDNLKVSRSAPTEVIRAAYKVLAQKFHPDRNPGDSEADRIMKTINTSYEVLSDPVKRQEHDQWVAQQELIAEQAGFSSSQPKRAPHQPASPVEEAAVFGLSEEEIEYLGKPLKAARYLKQYRISEDKLSKAIGLGKIRGVLCRGVLWVQDRKIA
jgi:DnaJ-class molecular chaperone